MEHLQGSTLRKRVAPTLYCWIIWSTLAQKDKMIFSTYEGAPNLSVYTELKKTNWQPFLDYWTAQEAPFLTYNICPVYDG